MPNYPLSYKHRTLRKQSSPLEPKMFPALNQRWSTLSEESLSTPSSYKHQKKEGYLKNTNDTGRYSMKKNPNDCQDTPYGIMP
jgi:hypothetical protein